MCSARLVRALCTEKNLLSKVWKDMDSIKFDNVIKTAMRTGKVDRTFKGPDGTTDVWYYWVQGRN